MRGSFEVVAERLVACNCCPRQSTANVHFGFFIGDDNDDDDGNFNGDDYHNGNYDCMKEDNYPSKQYRYALHTV